jgi:hypothetical protein
MVVNFINFTVINTLIYSNELFVCLRIRSFVLSLFSSLDFT